jgi:hypothetical protein
MNALAARAGVDTETCRKFWHGQLASGQGGGSAGGEGAPRGGGNAVVAWEALGFNQCPEHGSCRGIPG